MPHSVSPAFSPQEDGTLPDAPTHGLIEEEDDESSNDPMKGDSPVTDVVKNDKKTAEVKLEDFFNTDDEEDEEFPGSSTQSGSNLGKMDGNSPPIAPLYLKPIHK